VTRVVGNITKKINNRKEAMSKIDSILDKIRNSGTESLTPEDVRVLGDNRLILLENRIN